MHPHQVSVQPTPVSMVNVPGTDWMLVSTSDRKKYYYSNQNKGTLLQISRIWRNKVISMYLRRIQCRDRRWALVWQPSKYFFRPRFSDHLCGQGQSFPSKTTVKEYTSHGSFIRKQLLGSESYSSESDGRNASEDKHVQVNDGANIDKGQNRHEKSGNVVKYCNAHARLEEQDQEEWLNNEKLSIKSKKGESPFLTRRDRFKNEFLRRIVPWEKINLSWDTFPYYINEHTKDLLVECAACHLRQNTFASSFGARLTSSTVRILFQSVPGAELYRERLVRALAHELQVPLLVLDSSILAPYDIDDDLSSDYESDEDNADSGEEGSLASENEDDNDASNEEEWTSSNEVKSDASDNDDAIASAEAALQKVKAAVQKLVPYNIEEHEKITSGESDSSESSRSIDAKSSDKSGCQLRKGDRVKYIGPSTQAAADDRIRLGKIPTSDGPTNAFTVIHGSIRRRVCAHFDPTCLHFSPTSLFHTLTNTVASLPNLNLVEEHGWRSSCSEESDGGGGGEYSFVEKKLEEESAVQISHPWPEWVLLMESLLKRGYFDIGGERNPFRHGKFKLGSKDSNVIRTACLNFGRDQIHLLRFFSRKDMGVAVAFGCPSLDRKVINSGKRLRAHLGIDEENVCSSCNLRGDCDRAFVKTRENEGGRTVDVLRIIMTYGLDPLIGSVDNKPCLNKKVKESVKNLLREIVEHSARKENSYLPDTTEVMVKQIHPNLQDKGKIDIPMKQGDWLCVKCNFLNFARNIRCLRCDSLCEEKIKQLQEENSRLPLKKGDWICSICNFLNFAKNTRCLLCKEKPPKRHLNPGEWECDSCNYINFRRNMVCLKCDHHRPRASTFQSERIDKHHKSNKLTLAEHQIGWHDKSSMVSDRKNKIIDSRTWRSVDDRMVNPKCLNTLDDSCQFIDFPITGVKANLPEEQRREAYRSELLNQSESDDDPWPADNDEEMAEWFGRGIKNER